jgi:hypothetical protein
MSLDTQIPDEGATNEADGHTSIRVVGTHRTRAASQETALPEWEQEWREAAATDRAEQVRAPERTVRHRLLALLPPAVLAAAAPRR